MDYKEKYNKLVEAIKVLQEANPSDEGVQNWVEDNVPELAESEDERIRKAIICYIGYGQHCGVSNIDMIAWFEKQSEKTNPYSGVSFEYNGHIWGMCARDNGVDILLDKQLFKHLEKQNKQILANSAKTCKDEQKRSNLESIEPAWSEEDEKEWNDIIKKFTWMEWFDELNFLRHKLNR